MFLIIGYATYILSSAAKLYDSIVLILENKNENFFTPRSQTTRQAREVFRILKNRNNKLVRTVSTRIFRIDKKRRENHCAHYQLESNHANFN